MSKGNTMFGGRHNTDNVFDFYETPSNATEFLLKLININGEVLEPCNGKGAISSILKNKLSNSISLFTIDIDKENNADLYVDFLNWKTNKRFDFIITNPPFMGNYNCEFIKKSLSLVKENGYVIFLLKLLYYEGIRRKEFFENNPPKNIYVFSKRLKINKKTGVCYAWFVWQKNFKGSTVIHTI